MDDRETQADNQLETVQNQLGAAANHFEAQKGRGYTEATVRMLDRRIEEATATADEAIDLPL